MPEQAASAGAPSTALPVRHTVTARHEFRGMRTAEHYFTVPLNHFAPASDGSGAGAQTISVFAREYVSSDHSSAEAEDLPWLLFLQGGPGGRGNRLASLGGWSKAAARDFRILMLDQRGTGLSSPIDRNSLPARGTAEEQAAYLEHFRADSIVADAELIRAALGSGPWTIYGQSYGGFCALTYLSFAPEGVKEALITGGLAPLGGPADDVYRATFGASRRVTPNTSTGIRRTAWPWSGSLTTCARPKSFFPTAAGSRWNASRWWALSSAETPAWTACTTSLRMLHRHTGRTPALRHLPGSGAGNSVAPE